MSQLNGFGALKPHAAAAATLFTLAQPQRSRGRPEGTERPDPVELTRHGTSARSTHACRRHLRPHHDRRMMLRLCGAPETSGEPHKNPTSTRPGRTPTGIPRTRRHSAAHPGTPAKIEPKTSPEQAKRRRRRLLAVPVGGGQGQDRTVDLFARPAGRPGLPRAGCGDSVGILKIAGGACVMPVPSLPAFPQAGGLTPTAPEGWSGTGSNCRPSAFQKVCRFRRHRVSINQSAQLERIHPGSQADAPILTLAP